MNTEDKNKIVRWLAGPREFAEGAQLYRQYGQNLRLKRLFTVDSTSSTREILVEELRKLAGLSQAQLERLPRKARKEQKKNLSVHTGKSVDFNRQEQPQNDETALMELAESFGVSVDELVSQEFQDRVLAMDLNEERADDLESENLQLSDRVDELTEKLEEARSRYEAAPEPVRKMIRFREKYTFLNSPDCPDVLKVLVADMFTAYGNYKTAFAQLQVLGDAESAAAAAECEKVVEEYLKNREIWEELEYYRENGVILGKAAKFRELEVAEDLTKLTDIELMKKLQSAGTQVSKHKKAVNAAKEKGGINETAEAALVSWTETKKVLQAEAERRKKK